MINIIDPGSHIRTVSHMISFVLYHHGYFLWGLTLCVNAYGKEISLTSWSKEEEEMNDKQKGKRK